MTRSVILSAAKDLKTQISQLEILRRLRDSGWRRYCLPEVMPPGTTSLISVPEFAELNNRELAADAVGTLPHSLQSEMSRLAAVCDSGVNTYPIVSDGQGKAFAYLFPIDSPPNAWMRCGWLRNRCGECLKVSSVGAASNALGESESDDEVAERHLLVRDAYCGSSRTFCVSIKRMS